MNRVLGVVVAIVVAIAVYYGFQKMRGKAVEHVAAQKMDELRAEAAKRYPNMPQTDAIKAVAQEMAAKQLSATGDADQKKKRAAQMFFGYYFVNTKARVKYCRDRGTDLTPFVNAFAAANRTEYDRARQILGGEPESMFEPLAQQFAIGIEQDMKDVATGAGMPVEQTCPLFNEHAAMVVQEIKLPAEVRAALMAD